MQITVVLPHLQGFHSRISCKLMKPWIWVIIHHRPLSIPSTGDVFPNIMCQGVQDTWYSGCSLVLGLPEGKKHPSTNPLQNPYSWTPPGKYSPTSCHSSGSSEPSRSHGHPTEAFVGLRLSLAVKLTQPPASQRNWK